MKTLERYVFGAFLSSFLLAFLVLSFVLTIGLFVQIVGYILDGIPMELVGRFAVVSSKPPSASRWQNGLTSTSAAKPDISTVSLFTAMSTTTS